MARQIPASARDRAMSKRHLEERKAFNQKHGSEHAAAGRTATGPSAKYHAAKAEAHAKAAKQDAKDLKKLAKAKAKQAKT